VPLSLQSQFILRIEANFNLKGSGKSSIDGFTAPRFPKSQR